MITINAPSSAAKRISSAYHHLPERTRINSNAMEGSSPMPAIHSSICGVTSAVASCELVSKTFTIMFLSITAP
ncbi:hypothetical protein D3C80_1135090 [compost metagenome]